MITGTLTSTLRPIRIGFVIQPWDRAAALRAMQISTFLWGGSYNPIIPLHQRIDRKSEFFFGAKNAKEVFDGYFQAYDPDFVIRLGSAKKAKVDLGWYKEIEEDEILDNLTEDGIPRYGIGLFEILNHLLEEEVRFVRRDKFVFDFPEVGNNLLWTSIFGSVPSEVKETLESYLKELPDYSQVPCSIENYLEVFQPANHFLRRVGNRHIKLEPKGLRNDWIYLMDGTSVEDVVFYWNLRALGWRILPVPKTAQDLPTVRNHVERYVEDNYWPFRGSPSVFNHTTLLKAPSIGDEEHQAFAGSLNLKPTQSVGVGKLAIQPWVPRLWSEWDRRRNGGERGQVAIEKQDIRLTSIENRFYIPSILPNFAAAFSNHGSPRCANEWEPRVYGESGTYAEAIPQGGDQVARALDRYSIYDFRCSANGPVYYPSLRGWERCLEVPLAENVFKAWFKERGWEISLSNGGHIVKHVLKQFGGIWGTNLLTAEEVFKVLEEISRKKWLSESDLKRLVSQCSKKGSRISEDRIMSWFVESNIIKLGVELVCPQCRQKSWYSVQEADYKLDCRQCLETYSLPCDAPKQIKWAYRGQGAFASKEASQGALAVILTLRLFSRPTLEQVTSMLSFDAKMDARTMEIDLALHTRKMRSGHPEKNVWFIECKSHCEFEISDIAKMEAFTQKFPGAVMVFSTLRRELSKKEITMLTRVAKRTWKSKVNGGPSMPLVVLTGNELFSSSEPWQTWEKLGGKFSRYGHWPSSHDEEAEWLAEATQFLHLDFDAKAFLHRQFPRR
jgi:hypothetical protein